MNSIDQRTADTHKNLINIKSPMEYTLATLSRAIVSPNGVVVAYADANNNLLNAAGGIIGTGIAKAPCRAATTANITIATALNNGDTLDGVTLATDDRVLVKNQTTASENGIYIVGATPTRATDFDLWTEIPGAVVGVTAGTANAGLTFLAIASSSGVTGTDSIAFNPYPNSAGFTSPIITTDIRPNGNDGATLGTAALSFSDLFLASGAVINVANGNAVITHSSGIFTVSTGDLRVTTAGTNAASAVTVGGTQTLTNKTLTAPVIGVATGTSLAVTGLITTSSPSAAFGYATGAGVAATQSTSVTTAVTANGNCGTITTFAQTLAAGADVSFTFTNTAIAATDVVVVSVKSYAGTADGIPVASVQATAAGSCIINIRNTGAVTLDALAVLNFAIIKAVAA